MHGVAAAGLAALLVLLAGTASAQLGLGDLTEDLEDTVEDTTGTVEDTVEQVGETLTGTASPIPTASSSPTPSSTPTASPTASSSPTASPTPAATTDPTAAAGQAPDGADGPEGAAAPADGSGAGTEEALEADGADGDAESTDSPKKRSEQYAGGALFAVTATLALVAMARRGFF